MQSNIPLHDIDAVIDSLVPKLEVSGPGYALGLWVAGKTPQFRYFGSASRGGELITARTVFDLASISKMFTALAVLLAARRYDFTLETQLSDILPEMKSAAPGVKIRHLLHHTAGLPDYMELFAAQGLYADTRLGMQDVLRLAASQQPVATPGQKFTYSNTGYVLLSALIERLTRESHDTFARDMIFRPLGMTLTCVVDKMPPQMPHVAQSYAEAAGPEETPLWDMTGDGQVYSCLHDMGLWIAELLSPSLFREEIAVMFQPGALDDGTLLSYGFGLAHENIAGTMTVGHEGQWGGFSTSLLLKPKDGVGMAVLANCLDVPAEALTQSCLSSLHQ